MKKETEEIINNKVNSWLESANKGYKAVRKHLIKNTPLYTLFGIFNALLIYSTTIDQESVKEFLVPGFFLLSVLVWIVIFVSALKDSYKSKFNQVIYYLLAIVLLGLVIFFIKQFPELILSSLVIAIMLLPLYLIGRLMRYVIRPLSKWIKSKNIMSILILLPTIVLWILAIKIIFFFLKQS